MSATQPSTTDDLKRIQDALAVPFPAAEVKLKPQIVKDNRALAVSYIDVRLVEERLDQVVGIGGWQTSFSQVSPGSWECRLSLRLGGEWVTRADVGSVSEQPDAGDKIKAAYSDALKRAAVHFGVGRYLYRLPAQWMDYDPVKKQIVRPTPRQPEPKALPPAALPDPWIAAIAAVGDLKALEHLVETINIEVSAKRLVNGRRQAVVEAVSARKAALSKAA